MLPNQIEKNKGMKGPEMIIEIDHLEDIDDMYQFIIVYYLQYNCKIVS